MANWKNRKDGSGELHERLSRGNPQSKKDEKKSRAAKSENEQLPKNDEFDSIDLSSEDSSDSELDINELLRKYMPEYSDDNSDGTGVLSRLKNSAGEMKDDPDEDPETLSSDDKLISALDSAFSKPGDSVPEFDESENSAESYDDADGFDDIDDADIDDARAEFNAAFDDESTHDSHEHKKRGLFGFGSKKHEDEQRISEYEFDSGNEDEQDFDDDEDSVENDEPDTVEETVENDDYEEKPRRGLFGFFSKLRDKIFVEEDDEESDEDEPDEDESADDIDENDESADEMDPELSDILGKSDDEESVSENEAVELKIAPSEPDHDDELTLLDDGDGIDDASAAPEAHADDNDITATDSDEAPGNTDDSDTGNEDSGTSDADSEAAEADENDDEDEPVDSTDMNLLVAFGLDDEKSSRKADRAKQLGDRLEAKQSQRALKQIKLDRPEFVDKTQTPKIRREYRNKTIGLWIKLSACVIFTVLLMLFENIETLSRLFTGTAKQFGGVFDPAVYPVVYIMVSLQLMLLACLCALDQIIAGFRYLFRGMPKPETMLSLLTVGGILYSIILARVNTPAHEPVTFNFAVAVIAVFTLIYAIYNNKREILNFSIIANKKPKHIVRRLPDEESEGEAKAFEDTEDVCDVMKIEKTDFIDGFFGRMDRPDPATTRFMTALLSAIAAIGIILGILVSFRGGDADSVISTIYASMLIVAPISIFVTFSYPFYRANVIAKTYDSAIIGETSLSEYSNASIISFDDKNVFPSYSVRVQNIRIYNNARIDRVLYYAASVFAYAGGPLQDVFEFATVEMGHSSNVKIFDTEAGFLATKVDGVNIIFGTCPALRKRGFDIPTDVDEDDVDLSDELSIMYMFREEKLVAKMYIKYVMDADIDLILKQFSGTGLYVCVRTFDPNIDERMIARKLNMKRMPLKIVRYASAEEVTFYEEKVDSGLVTCGSPKSLLQIISYCEKVLRTRKTNIALSALSVMIGIAILVLLLLSGSLGVLNSLYIVIYQIIWMIPMAISSRMFIR